MDSINSGNNKSEHHFDKLDNRVEREFWDAIGLAGLTRAYDDDEPDYSNVPLIEENPKNEL